MRRIFMAILITVISFFALNLVLAQESDQKIMERYRGLLRAKPREGSAFDRLYRLYLEGPGLDQMVADYEAAVEAHPEDPSLHLILGHIYRRLGREKEAIERYRHAADLRPQDPYPHMVLGQLMAHLRRYDEAIERLEMAASLSPSADDMTAIYKTLGRCYMRKGETAKAIEAWRRIAELNPEDVFARLELADLFKEQELYDEAIEQHRAVIKLKGSDPYRVCLSLREIGKIYELKGDQDQAITAYEEAISKMAPDNWLRRELQGRIVGIYRSRNNLKGLIEYYQGKLKGDPKNVEMLRLLADVYMENDQVEEAIGTYRRALELSPSDAHLRLSLINALKTSERYQEAAEEYEKLIKQSPDEISLYQELGELYVQLGQPQRAKATWAEIEKLKPDDPATRLLLAEIYRKNGFKEDAIAQYEEAIRLAPGNPDYIEYLGEYHYKQGEREDALRTWRRMVEGEGGTGVNYSRLAEVLNRHGFKAEAIEAAQKAVELAPEEFRYWTQLASLLADSGRYDEALKALETASRIAPTEYFREGTFSQIIEIYRKQGVLDEKIAELEGKPEDLQNLKILARMYHLRGNVTKLMEKLKKAAELVPEDPSVLRWLAEVYERQSLYLDAIKTYERLVEVDGANAREYYGDIAKGYMRLGKRDEAIEAAKRAIAHSPRNPEGYRVLSDILIRWGETEEAIENLKRAVRLQPDSIETRIELARAYQRANRLYPAAEQYWRCFELADEMELKLSFVPSLMGVYYQLGRPEELIERFEEMHRAAKSDLTPLLALAELHKRMGDYNAARNDLTKALEINPKDPNLLKELVDLSADLGEMDNALRYQRELIAVEPSVENKLRYGELLFDAGMKTEAVQIWREATEAKGGKVEDEIQLARMFAKYGMIEESSATLERAETRTNDPKLLYQIGAMLVELGAPEKAVPIFLHLIAMPQPPQRKTVQRQPQISPARSFERRYPGQQISRSNYPPLQRRGLRRFQIYDLVYRIGGPYGYPGGGGMMRWMPGSFDEIQNAALVQLALIAQQSGELEEMMAQLEAQAEEHPENLILLSHLVKFYLLTNQEERARTTLERMLELSPDEVDLHQAMLELAQRKDEYETIERELRYLISHDPQNERWYSLYADVLKRMDRKDEAERILAKIYEENPSEPAFVIGYYRFLKETGKDEEAERILGRTLRESRSDPQVIGVVCNLLIQEHKLAEAERVLAEVSFEKPGDRRRIGYAYRSLGDAYLRSGELQKALDAYLGYLNMTKSEAKPGVYPGTGVRQVRYPGRFQMSFPDVNFYYDRPRLEMLRRMFISFWQAGKLEILYGRYEEELNSATGKERVYPALALTYFLWWEGRRVEAKRFMDQALAASPEDPTLRLGAALMAVQTGEVERGLELLSEVAAKSSRDRKEIARVILRLASDVGEVERAKESIGWLLEPPVTAQECMQLAQECQQYGFPAQAKEAAERAFALSRSLTDPNELTRLASLMSQLGLYKESQELAQRAVGMLRAGRTYSYVLSQISRLLRPSVMREREKNLKAIVRNNPNSYRAHLELATFYEGQNRVVEAAREFEEALKLRPNDAQTRMRLARMLRRRGDNEKAVEHYALLLERSPSSITDPWDVVRTFFDAQKADKLIEFTLKGLDRSTLVVGRRYGPAPLHDMIARECLNRNMYAEAIRLYERLIELYPENDGLYIGLADAYAKSGEIQKGIELLEKRMEHEGRRSRGIAEKLIDLYAQADRLEEIRTRYEAMLGENPDDARLNYLVALTLIRGGETEKAEKLIEKLFDSEDPSVEQYLGNLADRYMQENQPLKAAEILQRLIGRSPGPQGYYYDRLANAYIRANEKEKALSAWRMMLTASNVQGRTGPWDKMRVADRMGQHGMIDEAIKLYEEVINTSFDRYIREDAQRRMTWLLQRQGVDIKKRLTGDRKRVDLSLKRALAREYLNTNRTDKAVELYREILEVAPGDRESRLQLAMLYSRMGRYDDAIAQWKALLKSEPGNPRFQVGLVDVYLKANRMKDALKFAQEALSENENAETLKLMGRVYAAAGQSEKAIEAYEKAVGMNPTDYETYQRLGRLYRQKDDFESAVKWYREGLDSVPDQYRRSELKREIIRLYAQQGKLGELIESAEKFGIIPDFRFYVEVGRSYQNVGDLDKAVEAYKKAIGLASQPYERDQAQGELIRVLRQQGKLEELAESAEKEEFLHNYQFYTELAMNYMNGRRFDKAIEAFKKAISLSTEEYQRLNAYQGLMRCYVETGEIEGALETYLQLVKTPVKQNLSSMFGAGSGGVRYTVQSEEEGWRRELLRLFSDRSRLDVLVGMAKDKLRKLEGDGDRELASELWELVGATYIRMERFDLAADAYEHALKLKPGDVLNAYHLAAALKRAGEDERAMAALEKAQRLNLGGDLYMRIKVAQICRDGGLYEQAIELYEKAMAEAGNSGVSHDRDFIRFDFAQTCEKAERYEMALEIYEELSGSARDETLRRHVDKRLRKLYQRPEVYERSLTRLKKRLEENPDDADAHRLLANLYEGRGMMEEAIAHYKEAARLMSGDYAIHRRLAQLYLDNDDLENAAEWLKRAAETAPNQYERQNIYDELMRIYIQAERYERALEAYLQRMQGISLSRMHFTAFVGGPGRRDIRVETERERRRREFLDMYEREVSLDLSGLIKVVEKKLKTSPEEIGLWELAGALYMRESQLHKAANAYERMMDLKPDVITAYRLASIYGRLGMTEMAQRMFERASAMGDTDDANIRLKIAQLCREGGFYERAIDFYKRAMSAAGYPYQVDRIRFSLARTYTEVGKLDLALIELEKVATDTRDEYLRRQAEDQLRRLYRHPEIYEMSVGRFKRQIEENPDDVNAHRLLAKLYEAQGMPDEAISQYERVAQLSPDDYGTQMKLGELCGRAKGPDAAKRYYERAFQLARNQREKDEVIRALWNLYVEKEGIQRAVNEFEEFTAANPGEALAYKLLGDGYRSLGELDRSNDAYERWFELSRSSISPEDAYDYRNLADKCLQKGIKLKEALELSKRAVEISDHPYLLRTLAQAYTASGDYGKAAEVYERIIASPENEFYRQSAETELWKVYKLGNLYERAIERYKKQVESSPRDMRAYRNLGRAYEESGRRDEAIETYKTAIGKAMGDERLSKDRAYFERKVWSLYDSEGRYAEAVETFKSLVQADPEDALAYELLGDAHRKNGDEDGARAAYTRWLELQRQRLDASGGKDARLLNDIAEGCLARGFQLETALSCAQKAVELDRVNHRFIETLAWAYLSTGQYDRAKYELRQGASMYYSKDDWKRLIEASRGGMDERSFAAFWEEVRGSLPEPGLMQFDLALAEFYMERNEPEKAKEYWANIGFIPEDDWWLIGPFSNPGGSAFAIRYPPEMEYLRGDFPPAKPEATYQGMKGPIKWERRSDGIMDGKVDLVKLFEPNQWAIAYAYTVVNSPEEKEVELRIGSDDDIKVWLNGEEVLSRNVARAAVLDQDVVKVRLKAGENHILLKVCNRFGEWAFYFRIREILETPIETPPFDETAYDFQGEVFIYYDDNEPASWIPHESGKRLAESLKAQLSSYGIESRIGDAKGLRRYMEANGDGIVVMTLDVAPSTIFRGERDSFVKEWLSSGGKMIWTGDYEFWYYSVAQPDRGVTIDRWGAIMALDLPSSITPEQSSAEPYYMAPTELGRRYIPSLTGFSSRRPAMIGNLTKWGIPHEVYATDGENADPVMFRPRGGRGYFVKFQMTDVLDVEERGKLMAEFIKNRFISRPSDTP
jgi:tetratricopeptide (TPR) repeat protein